MESLEDPVEYCKAVTVTERMPASSPTSTSVSTCNGAGVGADAIKNKDDTLTGGADKTIRAGIIDDEIVEPPNSQDNAIVEPPLSSMERGAEQNRISLGTSINTAGIRRSLISPSKAAQPPSLVDLTEPNELVSTRHSAHVVNVSAAIMTGAPCRARVGEGGRNDHGDDDDSFHGEEDEDEFAGENHNEDLELASPISDSNTTGALLSRVRRESIKEAEGNLSTSRLTPDPSIGVSCSPFSKGTYTASCIKENIRNELKTHQRKQQKQHQSRSTSDSNSADKSSPSPDLQRALTSHMVEATVFDRRSNSNQYFDLEEPSLLVASVVNIEEEKEAELRHRRFYISIIMGCGGIVLAAVLTIILIFVFVVNNDENISIISNNNHPKLTMQERFAMFHNHIQDLVYDATTLEDEKSPQSKALNWMVTDDRMYDNDIIAKMLVTDERHQKLGQRFYLVVFYFSMTITGKWQHCALAETGDGDACVNPILESYPVEGVNYDQHMFEPTFRWLSPHVDECQWAGIGCLDGAHVSTLQLGGYNFQGTLPIELGQLPSLKVLDLHHNSLNGHLPIEWGILAAPSSDHGTSLSVLESLRLDQNELTGSIPEEWCSLNRETLQELILSNNNGLSGSLPSCLSRLTQLEDLSVMNNSMTGTIPESLGNLLHLKRLHLAGNQFHGQVPTSVCSLRELRDLSEASADCLNLESEHYVACPCCTKCCDGGDDYEGFDTCVLLDDRGN